MPIFVVPVLMETSSAIQKFTSFAPIGESGKVMSYLTKLTNLDVCNLLAQTKNTFLIDRIAII